MMGDFNMSLFLVIPELRARLAAHGKTNDLAAWFPWKMPNGTPCSDSCAIFFIGHPGRYLLTKGLADLHAKDPSGIYFQAAVAANGDTCKHFDVFPDHGPGFPLTTYLPTYDCLLYTSDAADE